MLELKTKERNNLICNGTKKRQTAEKIKEAKKDVAFAKLNNCPTSPRKMRLVADTVRGKKLIQL